MSANNQVNADFECFYTLFASVNSCENKRIIDIRNEGFSLDDWTNMSEAERTMELNNIFSTYQGDLCDSGYYLSTKSEREEEFRLQI